MKHEEITLLINTAFSIVELIARLQESNPNLFQNHEEKLRLLRNKLRELEDKPADYLQNYK
jgi:hypothetical protein